MEAAILDPDDAGATVPPHARATASPLGRPAAFAAELLGTFMLVFFIVMVLSMSAAPPNGLGTLDFAVIGLVHVFVLSLLVFSLGAASGAHFNPAVTIALLAKRKIGAADAAVYIVLQILGAILAALLAKALLPDAGRAVNYGGNSIGGTLAGSSGKALVVEFIGTFALMWSIMAMAVNPRGNRDWAPWVIGCTLGLAVMVFGPLTGAGFNPARAFGPDLIGDFKDGFGRWLLVYALGPILGALSAAFAYTAIVLDPQARLEERPIDKFD